MKIILTNYSFLGISNPLVSNIVKDTVYQHVRMPILKVKGEIADKLENIANNMGKSAGLSTKINSTNKKTYSQAVSEGIQKKVLSGEAVGKAINHKYTI